ncbi:MAG: hypothetical protein ACR65Z_13860 [Methylocystis sp.]
MFDNYAPKTGNARNIWSYIAKKVSEKQSNNVIINLRDSPITIEQIEAQVRNYPIDGLNHLWIVDQQGKLVYLRGSW